MEFQTRKTYYNRCDPFEPLGPEDDRNLPLDTFGPSPVRGLNWVDRLENRIRLSDKPVYELFTGLPGSGKSTELKRLAHRLSDPNGAYLLPVLIDAEQVVDLANRLDIPDVIAAILYCTEALVLEKEGKDPEEALQEGAIARLLDWLKNTNVELTKGEWSLPAGPKLVAEIKTRPNLRRKFRQTVAARLKEFLEKTGEELKALQQRATGLGYSGLIVIFDSLEKLRGISSNWSAVLESAEQLFATGGTYMRLPVHVLYTIPPALVTRRSEWVNFMPMIKLRERDGSRFEPGIAAARELVRRRVPDDVLGDLLGPRTEERIEELLRWSGGYPREIVRLLRSAFAISQSPISDDDLQRIVGEIRDAYRKLVTADACEWLAQVAQKHELAIQSDGHRPAADLMLQNNVVLLYHDGGEWFDLHPAVHQIPGVEEAKRKLATSSKSEPNEPGG